MEKQINIKIPEKDLKKFEKIRKVYQENTSTLIRRLIDEEYKTILKYSDLLEEGENISQKK